MLDARWVRAREQRLKRCAAMGSRAAFRVRRRRMPRERDLKRLTPRLARYAEQRHGCIPS
jgi:hypothetical protein